jgi:acyl carrier protein
MTEKGVRAEVKAMIGDLLEIDDFSDEEHFVRDLRADSMLLEELVVRLEKRYEIQLPNAEMQGVKCLTDAVAVVSRLLHVTS